MLKNFSHYIEPMGFSKKVASRIIVSFFTITNLFFSPLQSQTQHKDTLISILKGMDFPYWLASVKNLSQNGSLRMSHALSREIVDGYSESFFHIKWINAKSGNIGPAFYKVKIISLYDSIFYGRLSIVFPNYELFLFSDYNHYQLNELDAAYRNAFNRRLSIDELFKDEIFYGKFCGQDGLPPGLRMRLERMVRYDDKRQLMFWLRDPCVEIQIYAYEGMYRLLKKELQLNETEQALLRRLESKRGDARICDGTGKSQKEISLILEEIRRDWSR